MSQEKREIIEERNEEISLKLICDIYKKLEQSSQFYWNECESHFFYRESFGSIHCRTYKRPEHKNLLIIAPGRGESSLKYAETIYDLREKGFDIIVMDHRGQGFSERFNHCLDYGHIENSHDYVADLRYTVNHFKELKHYRKTLLLAHSMGAAISLEANIQDEDLFQGMILCSPMLRINTLGVPRFIAKVLLASANKLGWGTRPLYRNLSDMRSHENLKTSSIERYQYQLELEIKHPQIKCGAPTLQWLSQSLDLSKRVMKERSLLKVPILLIQAEKDELVCSKAQDSFAHEVENCRIIRVKNSRHEILNEVNDIRNRALVQIEKFLKEIV